MEEQVGRLTGPGGDLPPAVAAIVEDLGTEPETATVPEPAEADPADVVELTPHRRRAAAEAKASRPRLSWAPFAAYFAVWVVYSAVLVVLLRDTAELALLGSDTYRLAVIAGVALIAAGPLVALSAWAAARARATRGEGLLSAAFLRGGLVTALGAATWFAALSVLDALVRRG